MHANRQRATTQSRVNGWRISVPLVRVVIRRIPYNLSQMKKGRLGGRRPFSSGLAVNSPDELRTDLSNARIVGIRDVAEAAAADVPARIYELRMVEYVEEFSA